MHIGGENEYGAPFIHAGNPGTKAAAVINDHHAERMTVFGGSKYAWDSVYKFATACWAIVAAFWKNMDHDMLEQAGFLNLPILKPLKLDAEFFDVGTSFAVLNYPTDILDFVRSDQVKVYREDIERLSDHVVHLTGDHTLRSDALVASSGWLWRPNLTFKDTDLHADLGIPSLDYTAARKDFWASLDKNADAEISQRFPMLKGRKYPPLSEKDIKATPYVSDEAPQYEPQRFYRCIAPAGLATKGDRSLAFAWFGANITHSVKAELAGIWIYAYMNGLLSIDPATRAEEVYRDTSMLQRWSFRRHTYGFERRYADCVWGTVAWNDVLLKDLGMSGLRRGGSWWRECFEPYTMEDYRGITKEWMELRKIKAE